MGDDLNQPKEGPSGVWLIELGSLIENELDEQYTKISEMCNAIKRSNPETIELSKQQHIETIDKVDQLVSALNIGLKAFYVLITSLILLGIIGLGAMLFGLSVILSK